MDVHYSSKTDNWATPQDFFDRVAERFNFCLDPCADENNAKCEHYIDRLQDGLCVDWHAVTGIYGGDVWMNPPYGRTIGAWVKKAYETSLCGTTVVCLLPSRTDTRWFHDYCVKGDIEFIKRSLKVWKI